MHSKTDLGCPKDCNFNRQWSEFENPSPKSRVYESTRSNASEDAYRDFDGFDVNEELARLRLALADGTPEAIAFACVAMKNIDEHLTRWGRIPNAWYLAGRDPERMHTPSVNHP